jgi:putative endonuclease
MAADPRRTTGTSGEEAALRAYRARGYRAVSRNWRCRAGELDLVLGRGRTLVFCEVKTRSSTRFGAPVEAITATKQRRLRSLALQWLADTGRRGRDLRFDVASVMVRRGEPPVIEVLEGVF